MELEYAQNIPVTVLFKFMIMDVDTSSHKTSVYVIKIGMKYVLSNSFAMDTEGLYKSFHHNNINECIRTMIAQVFMIIKTEKWNQSIIYSIYTCMSSWWSR